MISSRLFLLLLLAPAFRIEHHSGLHVAEVSTTMAPTAQQSWLDRYDLSNPRGQFRFKGKLREISGLAVSDEGRLFAHDDELGIVYELDYTNGAILKRFSLGSGFVEEDFEGIACKKDTMFLVTSDGRIFEFGEADDRRHAPFRILRTGLKQRNDVEGLEYDPVTDCLLLALKGDPGKGYGGFRAVYAFSLVRRKLDESPRFLIDLDEVKTIAKERPFNPSGIALHPVSGTFFVISADGGAIVELDRNGGILAQAKLPRRIFPQPEGIAFGPGLSMIIANDGQESAGSVVVLEAKEK